MMMPTSISVRSSTDPPTTPPVDHAHSPALPRPLTSFIDRDAELAALEPLLAQEDVRLVTLTGPGGVGKTRIALALAERSLQRGVAVRYVPLETVRDPNLVLPFIAQRLLAHTVAREAVAAHLAAFLGSKRLLLVLDNLEQVADAAPDLARLLAQCPRLTLLVTSRVRLHISGERGFPIFPLPMPGDVQDPDPVSLSTIAAVRLFVERAQAAQPDFLLTADNAPVVAGICRRLDGLPLAIELAAARVRMLTPVELHARLEQRLPLLTGGGRDLPERQRTIRATIAWSYDQLAPAEQRFFRQMSVFVGGFTLAAAEALAATAGGDLDAMTGIATLVDHSLVRLQPGEGDARYLMLETVREFATAQLVATGEEEAVRRAHVHVLLGLARQLMPDLSVHPAYDAFARLDAEMGNIRAALSWLARTGRTGELADLVLHLRWLWYFTYVPEGLRWYETLLAAPGIASHPAYPGILRRAGQLATTLSPTSAPGIAYLTRARELARAAGDMANDAEATFLLGIAAEDAGDPENAEAHFHAARALWSQMGSEEDLAGVDYHLGIVAYGRGNLPAAVDLLSRASATASAGGDRMLSAWCSWYLALVACDQKAPIEAAAALGEYHHEADPALSQSLHWAKHYAAAAVLAAAMGENETAARLFGAMRAESAHDPLGWPERETIDRVAAVVRARLGEEADDAAQQAGARLPAGEVVAEIDRLLDRAAAAPVPRVATSLPITPREQEVLRLVVDGKSNQQIADALYLSPRTVSTHITSILSKLHVDSRTAAATYAIRHQLA